MAGSWGRGRARIAVIAILLAAPGCAAASNGSSVLDPGGPAAADVETLWWGMLWAATAVFLITMAFLAAAVTGRSSRGNRFIVIWGFALPATVLLALMAATIHTGARIYQPPTEPDVSIEVIAHQFWWEVRYGDGTITANEIHIPVGRPVELVLATGDVIHSFWVPELQGKVDMVPGRRNTLWLQADEPGVYRGVCAEYCGIQHAKMRKLVIAEPVEEFEAWLARQRSDAAAPADEAAAAGEQVFLRSSCVQCHAIRGVTPEPVEAEGVVQGPDLTHLASRRTIAAGILPNERGWLGGWILDPQSHKPGARMPPSNLSGPDLQALLTYLEGLG